MKSPYPWFGGKSRIAPLVWKRFGDVPNYVEPFFGGGAVLLARPHEPKIETVNDINAWLCNFWRAVKADPDAVADHASDPVNEIDLHARGDAIFYKGVQLKDGKMTPDAFVERMRSDPDFYDAKIAGWWLWGQCAWIGDNWGRVGDNCRTQEGQPVGVVHGRPFLGAGQGVNRKLPHLGGSQGVTDTTRKAAITEYMRQLYERMCRVRVCCGDWSRVLGDTPTINHGLTGVFLDPPYAVDDRDTCYGEDDSRTLAHDVREWAIAHGDNPLMCIALCGYDEHDMPESWECVKWKARGGYGSQRKDKVNNENMNRHRERVYFSPHCKRPAVNPLFAGVKT